MVARVFNFCTESERRETIDLLEINTVGSAADAAHIDDDTHRGRVP